MAETRSQLGYGDLTEGDTIEVYVCDGELGWQWEKREVVSIYIGRECTVTFRDPSDNREYTIDVRSELGRKRLMRRYHPMGYCERCQSPLTLHFYPRGATSPPGNMKICTNDECRSSLAGMKRSMQEQLQMWRTQGLLPYPDDDASSQLSNGMVKQ